MNSNWTDTAWPCCESEPVFHMHWDSLTKDKRKLREIKNIYSPCRSFRSFLFSSFFFFIVVIIIILHYVVSSPYTKRIRYQKLVEFLFVHQFYFILIEPFIWRHTHTHTHWLLHINFPLVLVSFNFICINISLGWVVFVFVARNGSPYEKKKLFLRLIVGSWYNFTSIVYNSCIFTRYKTIQQQQQKCEKCLFSREFL